MKKQNNFEKNYNRTGEILRYTVLKFAKNKLNKKNDKRKKKQKYIGMQEIKSGLKEYDLQSNIIETNNEIRKKQRKKKSELEDILGIKESNKSYWELYKMAQDKSLIPQKVKKEAKKQIKKEIKKEVKEELKKEISKFKRPDILKMLNLDETDKRKYWDLYKDAVDKGLINKKETKPKSENPRYSKKYLRELLKLPEDDNTKFYKLYQLALDQGLIKGQKIISKKEESIIEQVADKVANQVASDAVGGDIDKIRARNAAKKIRNLFTDFKKRKNAAKPKESISEIVKEIVEDIKEPPKAEKLQEIAEKIIENA